MHTVECSLTPAYRLVYRDTKVGSVLNQLSVLGSDRRMARLWPVRQSNLKRDSQGLARLVEGLVNANLATMDYGEIRTVALNEAA